MVLVVNVFSLKCSPSPLTNTDTCIGLEKAHRETLGEEGTALIFVVKAHLLMLVEVKCVYFIVNGSVQNLLLRYYAVAKGNRTE